MSRFVLLVVATLGFGLPSIAHAQRPGNLRDRVEVLENIEYAKAGDISLQLNVYKPKEASDQPRPCIVWIHGGGWQNGDKSSGLSRLARYVAGGQFVGASVGYRLTDKASFPAQIHDCKAAIRHLRANAAKYGIDPEKIGVWGSSAGGHLVSLLGTSGDVKEVEGDLGTTRVSSRVTCVVDFCGPADFLAFGRNAPGMNRPGQPVFKLFGGPTTEKADLARLASPITHVTEDDPPFLVVHGTDDRTVPFSQGEEFHKALKEAGVFSIFIRIDGGGHGIGGEEIAARVTTFFERHLLGKEVEVSAEPIKQAAGEGQAKRKARTGTE